MSGNRCSIPDGPWLGASHGAACSSHGSAGRNEGGSVLQRRDKALVGGMIGLALIANVVWLAVVVGAIAIAARWVLYGTLPW